MNQVNLIGHLGKDPEIKTFESGKKVANVSLATTETYKKDGEYVNQTEWHNLVCWSPLADVWESHLKKGSQIRVSGKIKTRSYGEEGNKKYITEIEVREFDFLDKKEKKAGDLTPEREENEVDDLPF